eukprot:1141330-Pelagomonas_calceolata.AAC.8
MGPVEGAERVLRARAGDMGSCREGKASGESACSLLLQAGSKPISQTYDGGSSLDQDKRRSVNMMEGVVIVRVEELRACKQSAWAQPLRMGKHGMCRQSLEFVLCMPSVGAKHYEKACTACCGMGLAAC